MTQTLIIRDPLHSPASLDAAAKILLDGGLIVFPTETVYGLGADARNAAAVRSIFAAKGRPADNPLIVHVRSLEAVRLAATHVPPAALELFHRYSPGPLTLVLDRSDAIPPEVSAGLPTVAVRIPGHPVALALLERAGVPVAAPSANLSGRPSPTTFGMALESMNGRAGAIIDGGDCELGLESTVVRVTDSKAVILRPGFVTAEMIAETTGLPVREAGSHAKHETAHSPGTKYAHYKPDARVVTASPEDVASILETYAGERVTVLCLESASGNLTPREGVRVVRFVNVREYSRMLYRCFAEADSEGSSLIVAETVLPEGVGAALMNRLRKASGK